MLRIIIGLALIAYGIYSGNAWFYLGVIPLITGLMNWCPMEKLLGGCKDGNCTTGSCAPKDKEQSSWSTTASKDETACCSSSSTNSSSSCCSSEPVTKTEKKEECCSSSDSSKTKIEILGTGCANCKALERVVKEAISTLDGEFEVMKVEDIEEIMKYKVMSTPALVVNGEVKSTGKVLTIAEVKELL
jgi:small redox-active disulfide protein 2